MDIKEFLDLIGPIRTGLVYSGIYYNLSFSYSKRMTETPSFGGTILLLVYDL